MRMYIGGEWVDRDGKVNVFNPYDGSVIDTVPSAGPEGRRHLERAPGGVGPPDHVGRG